MIDLRKIITQLDGLIYSRLEDSMVKSKADNSLYLLQSYRTGNPNDQQIIEHLKINSTSLYTLKSRLYDKIQLHITNNVEVKEEDVLAQVNQIHKICYSNSKDISIAYLTKLEKDLLSKDMHGELLVVYSALKQLNLFSEKYFHYSQLYNKQIAYSLTLEKSIEILCNFNRLLTQYDFSRSDSDAETLLFLHKGILEQLNLNSSKQIELIKNIIEIQLSLFVHPFITNHAIDSLSLLKRSEDIISELPHNAEPKQWMPVINFLYFYYYNSVDDLANAAAYFKKVDDIASTLLFYSNICMVSKFHLAKLNFLQKTDPKSIGNLSLFDESLLDSKNTHSLVMATIYNSVILYHKNQLKEAIAILNKLLNNISLKDLHYINIEIKLTLAFYYIKKSEADMAETIFKSLSRKIKADELQNFLYMNNLIKALSLDLGAPNKQTKEKQKDLLTLFFSKNKTNGFFSHLILELSK